MATITFREIGLSLNYTVACVSCRRSMRRTLRDSQTLNPFNRNAEGQTKNEREIYAELRQRLPQKVAEIKADGVTCNNCIERPRRALLLWLAADREFRQPRKAYYGSPGDWLQDRKHVTHRHDPVDDCDVFTITEAGRARAKRFTLKERAAVAPILALGGL